MIKLVSLGDQGCTHILMIFNPKIAWSFLERSARWLKWCVGSRVPSFRIPAEALSLFFLRMVVVKVYGREYNNGYVVYSVLVCTGL